MEREVTEFTKGKGKALQKQWWLHSMRHFWSNLSNKDLKEVAVRLGLPGPIIKSNFVCPIEDVLEFFKCYKMSTNNS
jgi:hypothetical protein